MYLSSNSVEFRTMASDLALKRALSIWDIVKYSTDELKVTQNLLMNSVVSSNPVHDFRVSGFCGVGFVRYVVQYIM